MSIETPTKLSTLDVRLMAYPLKTGSQEFNGVFVSVGGGAMSSCCRIPIDNARQWHKELAETLQEIDEAIEPDEPSEPEEFEEETEKKTDWVDMALLCIWAVPALFVGYMWASLLCGNL